MNEFEQQLTIWAEQFEYPLTPDMSQRIQRPPLRQRRPRLAWAMGVLIGLLASVLLVPAVRATAVAVIQAGAGTLLVGDGFGTGFLPRDISPPRYMTEITAAEASKHTPELFAPANWGPPDQYFLYDSDIPDVVVMVWLSDNGRTVDAALYSIWASEYFYKRAGWVEVTQVIQSTAYWIDEPHQFRVNQRWEEWRFIDSNTLIWWPGGEVTYRLESYLTIDEAVRAGESLVPLQEMLQDE